MPIQTIVGYLTAAPAVYSLVNERVSPLIRAQNEALPCVTLSLVSVTPMNHIAGAPTLDQNRVQVDSWASSYAEVRSVADACRAALEAAGLVMESEIDGFEADADEYRVTQDFYIWT